MKISTQTELPSKGPVKNYKMSSSSADPKIVTPVGDDGKIFLPMEQFDGDSETLSQIKSMVANPAIHHARVMPDCHAGIGCVVGFTAQLRDRVVPSWVGVDLGCGIITYPLGKLDGNAMTQKEYARIDKKIRENVPMGNAGTFTVHHKDSVDKKDIEGMCSQAKADCVAFVEAYKVKFPDINFEIPSVPEFSYEYFHLKCKKVLASSDRVIKSLGSLGGGNHYIEMNVSKDGVYYITIHCGSRSFGGKICAHHQGKIIKAQGSTGQSTTRRRESLRSSIRNLGKSMMSSVRN